MVTIFILWGNEMSEDTFETFDDDSDDQEENHELTEERQQLPERIPQPEMGYTEVLGHHASPENGPPCTVGMPVFVKDKEGKEKKYYVGSLVQAIKAQFEQWVRENALRAIREIEEIDPSSAGEMRESFLNGMSCGKYSWKDEVLSGVQENIVSGSAIKSAIKETRGMTYLTFLLMRRCHPKITLSEVVGFMQSETRQLATAVKWAMMGNESLPPQE